MFKTSLVSRRLRRRAKKTGRISYRNCSLLQNVSVPFQGEADRRRFCGHPSGLGAAQSQCETFRGIGADLQEKIFADDLKIEPRKFILSKEIMEKRSTSLCEVLLMSSKVPWK